MTFASAKIPNDVDPQLLLPAEARPNWAVVPRDQLYQLTLVGFLLGVGAALSCVGFVMNNAYLMGAFLISIVSCWALNKLLPWSERRLLKSLRMR